VIQRDEETTNSKLRLLVVGTLPPPIGGISMLFQYLVSDLSGRNDLEVSVVDLGPLHKSGWRKGLLFLRYIFQIAVKARKADVLSLHTGTRHLYLTGSILVVIGRLFRKPVILRKSAGTYYGDRGKIRKALSLWALRHCQLYLTETKPLVQAAKDDGVGHVEWFANYRPMAPIEEARSAGSNTCRKYVYLGIVRKTKGIEEIIAAAERFGPDVTVDVYGPFLSDTANVFKPFLDGMSREIFSGLENVAYKGVVPGSEVISLLQQYDALLLPSYHAGEGHPGILLEAFSAGLPVICTRWMSLPEVVDETAGILIEPRNADELHAAMKTLNEDQELFDRLRRGVQERRKSFSSEFWAERFVSCCRQLVADQSQRKGR
jgi:glycosyltransferase involved in cell wall biosynthesis